MFRILQQYYGKLGHGASGAGKAAPTNHRGNEMLSNNLLVPQTFYRMLCAKEHTKSRRCPSQVLPKYFGNIMGAAIGCGGVFWRRYAPNETIMEPAQESHMLSTGHLNETSSSRHLLILSLTSLFNIMMYLHWCNGAVLTR